MVRFLRENAFASVLLLLARLYVGWQWLKAGWGKVTGDFDATGFLKGAINKSVTIPADPVAGTPEVKATVAGWWGSFLEGVALPNSGLFSFLVAWGELLVGLGLILGCFTTAAIFFGMVMNFAFLFSGTVSSNALLVLISVFIIVAGYNAGKIGADYYVIPALRKWWNSIRKKEAVV